MEYWDTSAILKLYVSEQDSAYFLQLLAKSSSPIASSAVAAVEMLSALARKEFAGGLKRGGGDALFRKFQTDCAAGRVILLPYGRDVVEEAARLLKVAQGPPGPVMIRTLDLIHLASASLAKARTMVATDQRVRAFASTVGLQVLP